MLREEWEHSFNVFHKSHFVVFNALIVDWPPRGAGWATVMSKHVLVTGKRINKKTFSNFSF
jgi:hypothetical protein